MAQTSDNSLLIRWTRPLALLLIAFAIPMYSQTAPAGSPATEQKPVVNQSAEKPKQPTAVDRGTEPATPASSDETRQAQIEADIKKLYSLAVELRAEVAKTYKESLSVTVVKKAAEVEKMAKSLKGRMNEEAASAKHHD